MSRRRKIGKSADRGGRHLQRGTKVEMEKIDNKDRIIQIILSVISLCLLLFGIRIGLVTAFDGTMLWRPFLIPFLLTAVFLTVFIVYGSPLRIAWSSILALAGMAIYAWRHIEELELCSKVLLYYINKRYETYVNRRLFDFSWVAPKDALQENVLLTWLCFILVYFVALIALHMGQASFGLIPVYLVFVAGLSFGKAPGKAAVILLVCGTGIVLFLVSVRHKVKRKQTKYFVRKGRKYSWNRAAAVIPAVFILTVSAWASFSLCSHVEDDVMDASPAFQRKQLALEEKAIQLVNDAAQYMRGVTGMGGDGLLSNSSPHYTYSTVMEVTLDFKPHTNIYLRGFTGETYKNSRWTATDEHAFRENFPNDALMLWHINYMHMLKGGNFLALSDEEMLGTINNELSWLASEDMPDMLGNLRGGLEDSIHHGNMKMTYVGKERRRKTAYLPYYANFYGNDSVKILDDGSLQKEKKEFDTMILLMSQQKQKKYVNWITDLGWLLDTLQEEKGDYMYSEGDDDYWEDNDSTTSLEDRYQLYANVHYGNINDGNLPLYQQFAEQYNFSEMEDKNINEAVEKIQQILWNNTTYSLNLKPLPAGQDFAEYFLFYQQKGYCEHYATAGTILLRECNIPARYVSGYRIDNKSFKENADGTYTAKVLDSDAHAWTETWHHYTGWMPWEMTPSDGSVSDDEGSGETSGVYSSMPNRTFQPASDVRQAMDSKRQKGQKDIRPTPEPSSSVQPRESDTPQSTAATGKVADNGSNGTDGSNGTSGKGKLHITPEILSGMTVGMLLIIWIVVMLVRRIQYNGRRERILREIAVPGTSAVGLSAAYIVDALRTAGRKINRNADEETWLNTLYEEYRGVLTKEEQEEMWQLVQVGTYSKYGASGEEQKRFWNLCRKYLRAIAEGCSPPRKIIFHMFFKKE